MNRLLVLTRERTPYPNRGFLPDARQLQLHTEVPGAWGLHPLDCVGAYCGFANGLLRRDAFVSGEPRTDYLKES
ncbi:hypothetical protein Nepgr_014384 [Nepenthes gracilis]|uniref:Uncharacterized protein n=1 Tax=Nepenthes gracilis TaxID=150966 RepID=A0AAD3SJD1_NEPGR|nr:hypothetical protein Nepgr_014384 [Nepenthes gracilis]